ncbi:MAG: STAS/SEC14 domain-containing protein [Nitrospiraceae bacterium]|nr:MAG: STAS/SEC14 domain-containing protein [Nitrospiraceae bacterium]
MSVTYRIDKEEGTVYVEATGEITVEDLIETEKKIVHDKDLSKGFNTYADFSNARPSLNVNIDKIKISKEFVESVQDLRGKCKWAIFAPEKYSYLYSLMYATLSRDLIIETRVFRDDVKAKEWLKI